MDAALFTKMLSDKSMLDLKKLGYRYPQANMGEFVSLLKNGFYHPLPLKDFSGYELVYLDSVAQVHLSAARILLTPQSSTQLYGAKAMEEELSPLSPLSRWISPATVSVRYSLALLRQMKARTVFMA